MATAVHVKVYNACSLLPPPPGRCWNASNTTSHRLNLSCFLVLHTLFADPSQVPTHYGSQLYFWSFKDRTLKQKV